MTSNDDHVKTEEKTCISGNNMAKSVRAIDKSVESLCLQRKIASKSCQRGKKDEIAI
jgi:hypothetical protein